jgi:hypothetical protein
MPATDAEAVAPPSRARSALRALGVPGVLAIAISLLGLSLRIEHALTFDGPNRGSDYAVNMSGVHWMRIHKQRFDFRRDLHTQVMYQPPLWFAASGVMYGLTHNERSIAALAVIGWAVRQGLLALILLRMIPGRRWAMLGALAINAVLPISVLTDGKVNPEGLHTTLFTVAVYFLWRIEREATRPEGIAKGTAVLFGAFAGLALLTKASAAILPLALAVVLAGRAIPVARASGWAAVRRRLVMPAAAAALVWCSLTGWWVVPNLVHYGHPFPHYWTLARPNYIPLSYRRPLGWALPFQWKSLLELPVMTNGSEPRHNFWAETVVGTWSDLYNRGFCRLPDDRTTARVWGADDPSLHVDVRMTLRCVRALAATVKVGLWITVASLLSTLLAAWHHRRTDGQDEQAGSLALPVVIGLGGFFVLLFGLTYPYDWDAVVNPRYLLPISTPMSACLGFGLARLERAPESWRRTFLVVTMGAIAAVAILVVRMRWGG